MKKIFQFGEHVDGYSIPVLNEREIRAAAGLFFVLMFTAILSAILKQNFTLLKYSIVIFLVDFAIRVFINPKFAPSLILGRLIVWNQVPEYVGAPQKKFAWVIGLSLAVIMLVLQIMVNSYSPITGLICLICLLFLLFETSFGICLGCKFYPLFFKNKVQYCPGEVCDVQSRHEIQKTSGYQLLIVAGFIVFIVVLVIMFRDTFVIPPHDLFGLSGDQPVH